MSGFGFGAIAIDCEDPWALANFYGALLGRQISSDSDDDWVDLDGGQPTLSFQRVAHLEPPQWPDGRPQQMHLDLTVEEFASTHERVVALGAAPLEPVAPPAPGDAHSFRVYTDPAGHPFCLCMC